MPYAAQRGAHGGIELGIVRPVARREVALEPGEPPQPRLVPFAALLHHRVRRPRVPAVPVPAPLHVQDGGHEREPRVEDDVGVDVAELVGEAAGAPHRVGAHDDAARARNEQLAAQHAEQQARRSE